MLTCHKLPPLDKDITCDDAYTKEFRAHYIGKLTAIAYEKGVLRAMFGHSLIVAKIEVLPKWIKEDEYVSIDIEKGAVKISPCSLTTTSK